MESVTRSAIEVHWEYYLGLEDDFLRSSRYVNFTKDQLGVHSHFFTQMLICAAAEFETVCKAIADEIDKPGVGDIADIKTMLVPILPNMSSCWLSILRGAIVLSPFSDWKESGTQLGWWEGYQDVKHARHTRMESGSLRNALYALGGVYLANLVLFNTAAKKDIELVPNQFLAIHHLKGCSHPVFRTNYYQRGALNLRAAQTRTDDGKSVEN